MDLQKKGQGDKLELLLIYAFTQIDQSRRTEFIEHIQQNFDPMTTTGQSIYDSLIEEGIEKGIEKGREEGREEGQRKMVRNMHENGLSVSEIANLTGLKKAEVEKLLAEDPSA